MIANFNVDSRRFLQCSHGSPRCYTATAAYMYATAVSVLIPIPGYIVFLEQPTGQAASSDEVFRFEAVSESQRIARAGE